MTTRDPGLQPERTVLAWQRTALSLAVAATVVARLTTGVLGPLVLVVLALCLAHSARLFVTSRRSYGTRMDDAAGGGPRPPATVGVHAVLLCGQVLLLGVVEILALAVGGGAPALGPPGP